MESIELIVWLLAVAGVVVANLYKQWRRSKERGLPVERPPRPRSSRVPPAEEAVLAPAATPVPAERPSRFDEADWGRGPQREEALSLERLLEQALGERAEEVLEKRKPALPTPAARQVAPSVREVPVLSPSAQHVPTPAAPARPGRNRRRHPPLFTPHTDLRAAVIGMTVLGPCRALAPYEAPDSGAKK